jgi:poly(3-hydroxybutyrate) depolymerase
VERPVPLITFTGNVDRPWVERLVDRWVGINGCDLTPSVEDLGSGISRHTFHGCEADVVYYDIVTMEHAWPLNEKKGPGAPNVVVYEELDYLDEVLTFFAEHPMP